MMSPSEVESQPAEFVFDQTIFGHILQKAQSGRPVDQVKASDCISTSGYHRF